MFDAQAAVIRGRLADPASHLYVKEERTRYEVEPNFTADKTFYDQDNVFWVPPSAHFATLLKQAADVELPQKLDAAMGEIEAENASLKGMLYRELSRLALAEGKLGELMGIIAHLKVDPTQHGGRDVFVRTLQGQISGRPPRLRASWRRPGDRPSGDGLRILGTRTGRRR